ncbi:hypothetical protein BpHYR1_016977 [Brachionus plicatilis]|uniref:Secreted protein n=1 Tax=Brachionus plicatilis TaxID=10195 RepID=A0A3M7S916_BRAPC|nr:hypothetical protein BpHYR1_016977 [Brachionus plicatilis]
MTLRQLLEVKISIIFLFVCLCRGQYKSDSLHTFKYLRIQKKLSSVLGILQISCRKINIAFTKYSERGRKRQFEFHLIILSIKNDHKLQLKKRRKPGSIKKTNRLIGAFWIKQKNQKI